MKHIFRPPGIAVLCLLSSVLWLQAGDSKVGGRTSPDGTEEIQVDLPGQEHMKNKGGKDGAGLCVFTSIEIAGHWMNVEDLRGLQEKMTHEDGGGWPEKVDNVMEKYAPSVQYLQYSGNDPSIIKLALKTGRMVGVTYGYSPRYKGKISHMVDCVHFTDKWAAVLDNNFPGEDQYEWMAPDEFLNRWKQGSGGWVIVVLSGNPPPPIPVNRDYTPSPLSPQPDPKKPCPGPRPCPSCRADRSASPVGECCSCCSGCKCCCSCKCKEKKRKCSPCCPCAGKDGQVEDVWIRFPFFRLHIRPRPVYGDQEPDWSLFFQMAFRLDFFKKKELPTGVDDQKIPKDEPFYSLNGQKITALEAFNLVEKGGTLIDDTAKQRLTIIGHQDVVSRIQSDWQTNPSLAAFKDRILTNSYAGDHWAVVNVGLSPGMTSTIAIILQTAPDARGRGRVLHVQHDYQDGPEGLAKAISRGLAAAPQVSANSAVRKPDPGYDPAKDPDLRKDGPAPDPPAPMPQDSGTNCPILWTLIGVVVLLVRKFVPDLVAGGSFVIEKATASLKARHSAEIEALKAELARLKQPPDRHVT
jgi:hypothetical protein